VNIVTISVGQEESSVLKSEGFELTGGSQGYQGPSLQSSAIRDSGSQGYRGPSLLSSAIGDSASQSYGVPDSFAAGRSQAYGTPGFTPGRPLTSYGNPLENARYQVVPASSLPEQHSNLIRYIVLKEFRVSPNGSVTPLDSDELGLIGKNAGSGASSSTEGRGTSGEMEILKVQIPSSAETGAGSGATNVAYGPPGYKSGKPNSDDEDDGGEDNSLDDYEDDDYDNSNNDGNDGAGDDEYNDSGDDVDNSNSVSSSRSESQSTAASGMASFGPGGMQVVPARGVPLNSGMRQSQSSNRPQSSETEAFMFSDPSSASGETTSSRRQSTASFSLNAQANTSGGVRNSVRNTGNRVRNNRNRNRNNRNRNRNRNRANRNRNRNNRIRGNNAGAGGSPPQPQELTNALNVISRYLEQMRQAGGGGGASGELANSLAAPTGAAASSYSNIGGGAGGASSGGPYPASGQASSGTPSALSSSGTGGTSGSLSVDLTAGRNNAGAEAVATATQATFPASTYGPPPGSAGFRLQGGSTFPNVADAISRPIQQVAGFKSAIVSQLVNGLTNGIRNLGTSAEAGGSGWGSQASPSATAAPTLSPVYGPPTGGSGATNPLGLLRGIKGGIIQTAVNKGRAAVGIAGTKGRFVVNQVGTGANVVTSGISQTLNNKHDAFQNVIKHIQSIFNSNPGLLNPGSSGWSQ
jgi:hypothetical protein